MSTDSAAFARTAPSRTGPCRFCARPPRREEHRVTGPSGAICADCIEVGLYLALRGRARPPRELGLERLAHRDPRSCEFCGRRTQWRWLGSHHALAKVACPDTGAVICADCLNRNGELLNRAIHG